MIIGAWRGPFGSCCPAVTRGRPLRRKDVREAARCEGIDNADKFVDALVGNNAVPFAIKPVTLDMLIRLLSKRVPLLLHKVSCMKKDAS